MGIVPQVPPLWRESRVGLAAARLLRSPVWRGAGVVPGDGRGVLLVPGFLAGDGSLGTMAKWLRANGYWTRRAGIRSNIRCSPEGRPLRGGAPAPGGAGRGAGRADGRPRRDNRPEPRRRAGPRGRLPAAR